MFFGRIILTPKMMNWPFQVAQRYIFTQLGRRSFSMLVKPPGCPRPFMRWHLDIWLEPLTGVPFVGWKLGDLGQIWRNLKWRARKVVEPAAVSHFFVHFHDAMDYQKLAGAACKERARANSYIASIVAHICPHTWLNTWYSIHGKNHQVAFML